MKEELIAPQVATYVDGLVPPRPAEMVAMERKAQETGFPIIGPACGQFCYQVARMIRAQRIFEMGSGYGYSTAWFARAVKENGGGQVHHVVWDEALSQEARGHIAALGLEEVLCYHVAEAVQKLQETPGLFDIIFNDIDKAGYPDSLPVIKEKLRPGGALIIDNMLWHGRIFDDTDRSPDTEGVRVFTQQILAAPDWIVSLIPLRDGLILAFRQ